MKTSPKLTAELLKHQTKLVKKLMKKNANLKKYLSKARRDILELQDYLSEKEENEAMKFEGHGKHIAGEKRYKPFGWGALPSECSGGP